ncbi:uncharacterized protein LOC107861352 [Capsicum annuum]|uniref:uncharacterized protein LOC107861352 n=1 Tax=Capsicum annuum TaxID=4072 RepID=UPI0007BF4369|nr:uncharacterized protein LOC107861352 [Capsicum annuum]
MIVEEGDDKKDSPRMIDGDEKNVNEPKCILLPPMKIPPPFPQRLKKKDDNAKFKKFLEKLSKLSISIQLLEALQEILVYAKSLNSLMSKKRLVDYETIEVTHSYSAIMENIMVEKKKDSSAFTIPCTIEMYKFEKPLCDLGASINLIPYVMYQKLGLGTPTPTTMRLLMEDHSIKKLVGMLYDVVVKVDRFILLVNFVILDCEIDHEIPIILESPFLATKRALVNMDVER